MGPRAGDRGDVLGFELIGRDDTRQTQKLSIDGYHVLGHVESLADIPHDGCEWTNHRVDSDVSAACDAVEFPPTESEFGTYGPEDRGRPLPELELFV